MTKTSEDLREFLFSTLYEVKAGRCSPETASAIAKLTAQIINTVSVEIAYHRYVRADAKGDVPPPRTQITLTRREPSSKEDEQPVGGRDHIAAIARRPV